MMRPLLAAALASSTVLLVTADQTGPRRDGSFKVVSGQLLTPAGSRELLNDTLQSTVLSPDGKALAVVSGGSQAHQLYLLDATTGKTQKTISLGRSQSSGLAWSPDGKYVYVPGGASNLVHIVTAATGERRDLTLPGEGVFQLGLALSSDGQSLWVSDLKNNAVHRLSLPMGKVEATRTLTEEDRPGILRLSPDGKTLYAALWGAQKVLALDPTTLETRQSLSVGRHPNALIATADRLFVSCGNDDAVFILDRTSGEVQEKLSLAPITGMPAGVTPSALALSGDGEHLYVACSDLNAVAVIEVERKGHSVIQGYIPTAHYPTCVAVQGSQLFIGSAKGLGTGPNAKPRQPDQEIKEIFSYITLLLRGVVQSVAIPDAKQLASYTKQVVKNTPFQPGMVTQPAGAPRRGSSALPSRLGDPSPIQHVLYIIKENRTYDQVLGDLERGNGEKSLCLFNEEVTPNIHALAREYVTLDNFYASGEVSVDGHHWSNGAYVTDYMQRTWPAQYGAKGAPPGRGADSGDPLFATPNGRIWDLCARANLSFRTFYYHTSKNRSEEWAAARARGERDYVAADIFLKELAEWEKSGQLPRFCVMALSEDHTRGTTPGAFTPKAAVASNDLAVGKIVEACSKSKFWSKMAIFIVEDDAQNGPDHIDAHRTVALAISPYTRLGKVDSTFYNTCSLLRSMELILGLPPMSAFDAGATPLYASFGNKPDPTPFVCRPARIDLQAKNPPRGAGAAASLTLNLTEPDQLSVQDEDTLNRVLWHAIKGEKTPYPGIVRRPRFLPSGQPLQAMDDDD